MTRTMWLGLIRFVLDQYLLLSAVAVGLFTIIMFILVPDAQGLPVILRLNDVETIGIKTSFHPSVDAKRRVLMTDFDFRDPVNLNVKNYLKEDDLITAIDVAFILDDFAAMRDIVQASRRKVANLAISGGDNIYDALSSQDSIFNKLEDTILFEAISFDQLGIRSKSLEKYSLFLDLTRQLSTTYIENSIDTIGPVLTAVRIKIYYLKRGASGKMPYIDEILKSYVNQTYDDDYGDRFTTPRAKIDIEAEALDTCLKKLGPHKGAVAASADTAPCGADYFARDHGGFGFASALLEYDRLHNGFDQELDPIPYNEVALTHSPPPPGVIRINWGRFMHQLADAKELIQRINKEAPEATFLVDDLIDGLSRSVEVNQRALFDTSALKSGQSSELILDIICRVAPVTEPNGYVFDRVTELQARLLRIGRRCK